jgi:exopolysaccharide biosynthesis WecB/TagA/CpsF family protein
MPNFCDVERPGHKPWRRSRIQNAWVDNLDMNQLMERLDEGLVFTLNPDHLYHLRRNPEFAEIYSQADYVTSDSKYVYWALGFLGRRIPEKVSGSDIVPTYWKRHAQNPDVRIFFLGAGPGIAQRAMDRINGQTGRETVVGAFGPSYNFVNDEAEIQEAIARINACRATCVIIGLGAPKQEIWVKRYRHLMPGVKIYMGVGATIDYEADAVRRAPGWMGRNGLEWVYRMATEPRRYWRRYYRTIGFFGHVLLDRIGLYRPPSFPSPAFPGPGGALAPGASPKGAPAGISETV